MTREEVQALTGGEVIQVDDRWDVLLPASMSDADLDALANKVAAANHSPRPGEPVRIGLSRDRRWP